MLNPLKYFISILITISLLGAYNANYLWLRFQRHKVKREIKNSLAELNRDQLILLSFSKSELVKLKWKHSHEFEYKGKMYDIVERYKTEEGSSFLCWLDKEETDLNNKLARLLDAYFTKDPIKNNSLKQLRSFYQNLFSGLKKLEFNPLLDFHRELMVSYSSIWNQVFLRIPIPPPK